MLDFFDKSIQTRILQMLLNVSSCLDTSSVFLKNLLPSIQIVAESLKNGVHSESDKERMDKLSSILQRVSLSMMSFEDLIDDFETIGDLYDQLSN